MNRLSITFMLLVLCVSGLAIAEERLRNQSFLEVSDGLIATHDGRPGTAMARFMQPDEVDLSDVAIRKLDMIYGRKYGTALTMDVYQPNSKPNGAGVIHIISGGLWSGPEYRRMPGTMRYTRALVERGYTVFTVMHGSQPKYNLLEIRDDIPRSVRYIRHHAGDFGIQPDRIGLIGFSSGGHLALLAATTGEDGDRRADDPVDAESSRVQAAVAYFPNSDLLNYGESGKLMPQHFRDCGLKMDSAFDFRKWDEARCIFVPMTEQEVRTAFRDASPLSHVSQDDPPILLVHGDRDEFVPLHQSQDFERRMKQVGAQCEVMLAAGQRHGWQEFCPARRQELRTGLTATWCNVQGKPNRNPAQKSASRYICPCARRKVPIAPNRRLG